MARIKKKGTSGNAKNYITRTQAVRKLQVSLADFRRLCIFKGIYPREPRNKRKANKGKSANVTFYYAKDIQYLLHESILDKFREHKTFAKKLQRALGRGELHDAQRLEKNRPKYTLDHVIKERYPTFLDALRDLDDPLNMLFLFSNLPATDEVSSKVTKQAEKLCNQWLAYVAKERVLKKVFVLIKGVYYEANVKGQEIRWLVPFKFPTNIPTDVDFRIMLTFLEFYSTLLHFVLFRLYADANLIYPPTIDIEKLKGIGGLSAYVLKTNDGANSLLPSAPAASATSEEATQLSDATLSHALEANNNETNDENVEDVELDNVEDVELDTFESTNKTTGDLLSQPSKFSSPTADLFSKFIFYVGREVSLDILELCIVACGGSIVLEIALDELRANLPDEFDKLDLSNITHQIVDRPKLAKKVAGRTYIQPQWIFDCINKSEVLPVNEYAPGEVLPPHLSPWGDASGYDPEKGPEGDEDESESEDEEEEEEEEEEDEDIQAQRELEMEAAGVKYAEASEKDAKKAKKQGKKRVSEEDEEKELKKIMMTKRARKQYNKAQGGIDRDELRQKELAKKRKQIEKKKAEMEK